MNAILATTAGGIIGDSKGLPWRCKPDLDFFKETTKDAVIIMGSTTFKLMAASWKLGREFMPNGSCIIVVSSQDKAMLSSLVTIKSERLEIVTADELKILLENLWWTGDSKIYVAGGAQLFESLIDLCDTIYITTITPYPPLEPSDDYVRLGPKMLERMTMSSRITMKMFIDSKTYTSGTVELLKRDIQ